MMVNSLEWLYLSITHYQVHDAQGREREGKADKKSILYQVDCTYIFLKEADKKTIQCLQRSSGYQPVSTDITFTLS